MNLILLRITLPMLALLGACGCQAASSGRPVKDWKTYRVEIPNFLVEFKIPPELKVGYGGVKTRVTFVDPRNDQFAGSFGDGAFVKDIATFFKGLVGDFRGWDARLNIFVLNFDAKKSTLGSTEDLAKYLREVFSKKTILKTGEEISDVGSIAIEAIGPAKLVVATSSELHHVSTVKLKDGAEMQMQPYRLYYLRLDDEVVLGLAMYFDTEKHFGPKSFDETNEMVGKIIESMSVHPRPRNEQNPSQQGQAR